MAGGVVAFTAAGSIWSSFTCSSYDYYKYLDGDRDNYEYEGKMKETPSRFGISDLAFLHSIPTFTSDSDVAAVFTGYEANHVDEVELVPVKVGRGFRSALRVMRREPGLIKLIKYRSIWLDTGPPVEPGFYRLSSVPEIYLFYKFDDPGDVVLESLRSARMGWR